MAFDRHGAPWMVVECKAPGRPVGRVSMDQAARYNRAMGARFVVVTNGLELVGWEVLAGGAYRVLEELPGMPPA